VPQIDDTPSTNRSSTTGAILTPSPRSISTVPGGAGERYDIKFASHAYRIVFWRLSGVCFCTVCHRLEAAAAAAATTTGRGTAAGGGEAATCAE